MLYNFPQQNNSWLEKAQRRGTPPKIKKSETQLPLGYNHYFIDIQQIVNDYIYVRPFAKTTKGVANLRIIINKSYLLIPKNIRFNIFVIRGGAKNKIDKR